MFPPVHQVALLDCIPTPYITTKCWSLFTVLPDIHRATTLQIIRPFTSTSPYSTWCNASFLRDRTKRLVCIWVFIHCKRLHLRLHRKRYSFRATTLAHWVPLTSITTIKCSRWSQEMLHRWQRDSSYNLFMYVSVVQRVERDGPKILQLVHGCV